MTDEEIVQGIRLLAETEGILTEPAGGVVVAGLRQLVAEERIERDESVVICITGSGLKTTELFKEGEARRLHAQPLLCEDARAHVRQRGGRMRHVVGPEARQPAAHRELEAVAQGRDVGRREREQAGRCDQSRGGSQRRPGGL